MNFAAILDSAKERLLETLQLPLLIEFLLLAAAMSVLMIQAFFPLFSRRRMTWIVILSFGFLLVLSLLPIVRVINTESLVNVFGTSYRLDPWTMTFRSFFLLAGLGVCLLALPWVEHQQENAGEYLSLLILAVLAMVLCTGVADFTMLFVTLEFLTITSYVLVGIQRRNPLSLEAGIKYLIVGATASAMMVYGITLIFGMTGTLQFEAIDTFLRAGNAGSPMIKFGLLLVLSGLGFKIAAFPFHWWVPDVYQGAPLPTVALLSTGSKAAGFVLMIRVLHDAFQPMAEFWQPILGLLAAATILYGSLAALTQNNLKRLLGYSSISHSGVMMLGLAAGTIFGQQALIFYLYAYLFGVLLVICPMALWETPSSQHEISEYSGLRDKSPWLAAAMMVGLVSLAGIPPLIGFFGKFLLLIAILEQQLYGLAVILLIGVGASLYYYLRVIRALYFARGDIGSHPVPALHQKVILGALIALTFFFGLCQEPLWRQASAQWLDWFS